MTEIASDIVDEVGSLIDTYGDTITIYSPTESFSSYYHDKTTTWSGGTSAKGLVITTSKDLVKETEGELQRGRTIRMYIKSSVTIANNYKVTHNSIDYLVTYVETKMVEDTVLYYIVELTKMTST